MTTLLRRAALHIVNQSSIPILLKRVQKSAEGAAQYQSAEHAQMWLKYVSKHCPALYKLHVGELAKGITDERNERLVEVCLQAYSVVARSDPKFVPNDRCVASLDAEGWEVAHS